MQTIAAQQDEPLADPVCVPLYFVTRLARETGTLVLHAGEGADEIFCGYEKYAPLTRYERYWRSLSCLPAIVPRTAGRWLSASDRPRWRKAGDALSRLGRGQRLFLSSSVACFEGEKARLLSADFRHRTANLDSFDVAADIYGELAAECPEATFQQQVTYHEMRLRLPELLLMRVDKMSMLNSVEVRVPFLDRHLVDFALSVPETFKRRDGIPKEPVKRLAARHVPRDWVYRKKSGFGAPIQDWFSAGLGREMRRQLHADREALGEFFDIDALDRRLTQPIPSVNDAFQLWTVYNFIQWRQSFVRPALCEAA
jgi:asparagine synthase (glutamine-hydrolysing)